MSDNLCERFQAVFRARGDAPALADAAGEALSFAALDDLVARFSAALGARGVGPGDRVMAQVEKSVGAVALYLAALRRGAIYAPLNTAYTPSEVEAFLADAEPRLFVSGQPSECGASRAVLGETAASPFWAEALAAAPDPAIAPAAPDDIAALIYTSGTTGRSKGAMLSHANLAANAKTLVALWGMTAADRLIHALPIFHVHGLFVALHTAFLAGATTCFLPKFDAGQVCALLPRATMLMGVPTFYTRLLDQPNLTRQTAAGMRLFISGSAPLLAETHRAFEARTGHRILERYGMTEAGMITSNPLAGDRIAGTVGYPLPDVELRIVDGEGQILPPGEAGVIEIRGPNVFKGYWRMPDKTAADFRDGWFITGDVAVAADDGRVTIVGRAKDLIISGGYNIYPIEIEAAIDALPGVLESAVVAAPHPDLGEGVVAMIVPEPGAVLEAGAIEEALSRGLARFKRPRRIYVVEALPRNAMGKVQKAALRAQCADAFT
jgi:malonyl-CoA/methylmalonyl-CoA synthetase